MRLRNWASVAMVEGVALRSARLLREHSPLIPRRRETPRLRTGPPGLRVGPKRIPVPGYVTQCQSSDVEVWREPEGSGLLVLAGAAEPRRWRRGRRQSIIHPARPPGTSSSRSELKLYSTPGSVAR